MALDWRKAFDRVNLDSMVAALERFGFLPKYRRYLRSIMDVRRFCVEDMGSKSALAAILWDFAGVHSQPTALHRRHES